MKLLILADLDDFHWRHGTGVADAVLACGDVEDAVILEAAQAYACTTVFAVKGNHDRLAPFPEPVVDLHVRVHAWMGLRFAGHQGAWRYKPRGHYLYDQTEVRLGMAALPPVDVLLAHNSPRAIHDRDDGVHVGFDGFIDYIQRAQPRLVIHGHQHQNRESWLGSTRIIGVHGARLLDVKLSLNHE